MPSCESHITRSPKNINEKENDEFLRYVLHAVITFYFFFLQCRMTHIKFNKALL